MFWKYVSLRRRICELEQENRRVTVRNQELGGYLKKAEADLYQEIKRRQALEEKSEAWDLDRRRLSARCETYRQMNMKFIDRIETITTAIKEARELASNICQASAKISEYILTPDLDLMPDQEDEDDHPDDANEDWE